MLHGFGQHKAGFSSDQLAHGVEAGAEEKVEEGITGPSLVVRFRVALPLTAQTERNSVTDAITNYEFYLEDMVETKGVVHW